MTTGFRFGFALNKEAAALRRRREHIVLDRMPRRKEMGKTWDTTRVSRKSVTANVRKRERTGRNVICPSERTVDDLMRELDKFSFTKKETFELY